MARRLLRPSRPPGQATNKQTFLDTCQHIRKFKDGPPRCNPDIPDDDRVFRVADHSIRPEDKPFKGGIRPDPVLRRVYHAARRVTCGLAAPERVRGLEVGTGDEEGQSRITSLINFGPLSELCPEKLADRDLVAVGIVGGAG